MRINDFERITFIKKLTQNQAANIVGISLRSYKQYENDDKKIIQLNTTIF